MFYNYDSYKKAFFPFMGFLANSVQQKYNPISFSMVLYFLWKMFYQNM